ncbi:MAG: 3,4-dihydroxy-2-butanone-4-phosphate synthase [Alcaligenaceae bacterium]|jgi:3,4-dihydroxy 2-butanone 4-phosphate synthase/GTP cyclohydrolase II|nr:3,4-dihydroxy-2-butanone-4-phosphate synthase [Alcaligenaceae bacterium]
MSSKQSQNKGLVEANDSSSVISSVTEIVEELRQGRMVILVDEEDRENEGDLLMAADFVTPEAINFMVTHARGLVCLTLTGERSEQLGLGLMTSNNQSGFETNFTISIEAAEGVTTGISAADRATTIKAAVAPGAGPADLVSPGHIFPVQAVPGGVLIRAGHTEAGCDLTAMAGLTPAAVICEILKPDGEMARLPDLIEFSKEFGIKIGTIADLIQYRSEHESMIKRLGSKQMKTPWGTFEAVSYQDKTSDATHIALVHGDIKPGNEVLVRVHEPVTMLDVLDTEDTSHSWGVASALEAIKKADSGVMVMLNCDQAHSSAEVANQVASWGVAEKPETAKARRHDRYNLRTYGVGAQILRDLNVSHMRLMATPVKMPSMAGFSLTVTGFYQDQNVPHDA